jgi:hypothetical protein
MNMLPRWKQHAKKCRTKINVVAGREKEAMHVQTPLVLLLNAAAEMERKKEVDTYVTTYWIYKHKMPFTTGPKVHEVIPPPPPALIFRFSSPQAPFFRIVDVVCFCVQLLQHLHCADKKAVEKLALSRFTVARYGLTICSALTLETKQMMTDSVARYTFIFKLDPFLPPVHIFIVLLPLLTAYQLCSMKPPTST